MPGTPYHRRKVRGVVHQGSRGGYGPVEVEICEHDDILSDIRDTINVWSSHADEVLKIPDGFICLAYSAICPAEAIALQEKHIYGLQWHPEVSHTFEGKRVFENFDRITLETQSLTRIYRIIGLIKIPEKIRHHDD